jgi:hypothetical protein
MITALEFAIVGRAHRLPFIVLAGGAPALQEHSA